MKIFPLYTDGDIVGGVALPQAILLLLKEHRESGPHQSAQVVLFQLRRHSGGPSGPVLLDVPGDLPLHGCRRGTRPTGVGKDVHGGKGAPAEKGQGLGKLILRLLGEAYNEVGGDSGVLKDFPE